MGRNCAAFSSNRCLIWGNSTVGLPVVLHADVLSTWVAKFLIEQSIREARHAQCRPEAQAGLRVVGFSCIFDLPAAYAAGIPSGLPEIVQVSAVV